MRPTIAFAGGYTAGHITPALAVIDWLRSRGSDAEFLFLGTADAWERELVMQAGVRFVAIPSVPWAGQGMMTRVRVLGRMGPAILSARKTLRATKATALVGLGSFASFAPVIAARTLGIPVTLFEPNATVGLANRLARPFARTLLVSKLFSEPRTRGRVVEVGVPLPRSLFELLDAPSGPPGERVHLLVLGGSLGNMFLNDRMPEVALQVQAAVPALHVTHQCGYGVDPAPVAQRYAAAKVTAEVGAFFPSLAPRFRAANFVVSAAGAISLHELAVAGVPSLIVPLDHGGGAHQLHNAASFARITGCPQTQRSNWSAQKVATEIVRTMREADTWRERQRGMHALVDRGTAESFAREIMVGAR
ncbi:MAG: glycosyltransferase [Verrucomicrobiota bacterium]